MSQNFRIGIIGGTGLGDALIENFNPRNTTTVRPDASGNPFGPPASPIILGEFDNTPVALLQRHGEHHLRNPAAVPYRANIFALKQLGCTHIIASGAVGSLREDIHPGSIVLCNQLIDKTDGRPRTFYENAAVHVEFADPFCPIMRQWLLDAGQTLPDQTIHSEGTYVCMEGPSFSTRAEAEMHRQWGGDIIGMTACPEARLAREAEMAYALIALPTDYDCFKGRPLSASGDSGESGGSLIAEIIANLQKATAASIALIKAALNNTAMLQSTPSPAHEALTLAIWSDKSKIEPTEIKRLHPLWGRHFPEN